MTDPEGLLAALEAQRARRADALGLSDEEVAERAGLSVLAVLRMRALRADLLEATRLMPQLRAPLTWDFDAEQQFGVLRLERRYGNRVLQYKFAVSCERHHRVGPELLGHVLREAWLKFEAHERRERARP